METRDRGGRSSPSTRGEDDFDQILASARNGDGPAFARLYESLNQRILAFVSFRGAADPGGMVNDVFLKVFTKLNTFDGNEIQFAAWVFKIARNTLIDESRSLKRRPMETGFHDAQVETPDGTDVEMDALERMSTSDVLRHLDVLTPEQRDVVVMRVVSDLTIEVIAEILDRRVGAIKAMQRRAMRTLAKSFDREAVPQ